MSKANRNVRTGVANELFTNSQSIGVPANGQSHFHWAPRRGTRCRTVRVIARVCGGRPGLARNDLGAQRRIGRTHTMQAKNWSFTARNSSGYAAWVHWLVSANRRATGSRPAFWFWRRFVFARVSAQNANAILHARLLSSLRAESKRQGVTPRVRGHRGAACGTRAHGAPAPDRHQESASRALPRLATQHFGDLKISVMVYTHYQAQRVATEGL